MATAGIDLKRSSQLQYRKEMNWVTNLPLGVEKREVGGGQKLRFSGKLFYKYKSV